MESLQITDPIYGPDLKERGALERVAVIQEDEGDAVGRALLPPPRELECALRHAAPPLPVWGHAAVRVSRHVDPDPCGRGSTSSSTAAPLPQQPMKKIPAAADRDACRYAERESSMPPHLHGTVSQHRQKNGS